MQKYFQFPNTEIFSLQNSWMHKGKIRFRIKYCHDCHIHRKGKRQSFGRHHLLRAFSVCYGEKNKVSTTLLEHNKVPWCSMKISEILCSAHSPSPCEPNIVMTNSVWQTLLKTWDWLLYLQNLHLKKKSLPHKLFKKKRAISNERELCQSMNKSTKTVSAVLGVC